MGTEPSPDSAIVLDPVVATAAPVPVSASALGRHASVLDGERLRAEGVVDVAGALRIVAGVAVVRSGSFGAVFSVFLRGGESDYVRVLLDGVALNQPGGAIDFADLTVANVDRIGVVRRPASGLYGSCAVSGVIQIFIRRGEGAVRARPLPLGEATDGRTERSSFAEKARPCLSPCPWRATMPTGSSRPTTNRHLNTVLSWGQGRTPEVDRPQGLP